MRPCAYKRSWGIGCLLIAASLLSGCDMVLMSPKGQIGLEQKSLILTALGLMLIVVIPVIIMAVVFARKYRASNTSATYLPNWAHSTKIEAVVWTVPIIIIVILAAITWKTSHDLDPYKPLESNVKPVKVDVISLDWKWLFVYPELGIASVNELAFPANTPINFRITSDTVMNSFFIPQLGGQIYAMTGMQTKLHLIADEPGQYKGISASYSGKGFSGMKFTAIATADQAGFDAWVAKVKASGKTLDNMDQFAVLAKPTEYHPVEYYGHADPELFAKIINKFMGHSMPMQHGEQKPMQHEGAEAAAGQMDHAAHMNMEHTGEMGQMDHSGHMQMDDQAVNAEAEE